MWKLLPGGENDSRQAAGIVITQERVIQRKKGAEFWQALSLPEGVN